MDTRKFYTVLLAICGTILTVAFPVALQTVLKRFKWSWLLTIATSSPALLDVFETR